MTHYRREDDNSFSVKLEGSIEGVPLFEQLCILREIDLHYKWSPGCTSSVKIADLDKLDRIGWGIVGLPSFGLARDICYRVIGCDNTMEDGTIILAGQGIFDRAAHHAPPKDTYLSDDPILAKLDIPPGTHTFVKFAALMYISFGCIQYIVALEFFKGRFLDSDDLTLFSLAQLTLLFFGGVVLLT